MQTRIDLRANTVEVWGLRQIIHTDMNLLDICCELENTKIVQAVAIRDPYLLFLEQVTSLFSSRYQFLASHRGVGDSLIKCNEENNTQEDRNAGHTNVFCFFKISRAVVDYCDHIRLTFQGGLWSAERISLIRNELYREE